MADLPTFDELYDDGKAEILTRNPALTDFNEGSALDAVTGAGAILADETMGVVVDQFAAHFIDSAEGAFLDALAADRFLLSRKPATSSVGTVAYTVGNPGDTGTIAAGTRFSGTVNGETIEVVSTTPIVVLATDTVVDVPCAASVEGPAGNVDAGVIDTLVDSQVWDTGTPSVTNAERFAGGSNEESDPLFRDRIRRYFTTLRKGTVPALEAGALSVPGVQYVTVDESTVPPASGGFVSVYIGDPDGAGNAVLAGLVDDVMPDWRSAGVMVSVLAASREEIALALTLYVRAGADREAVADAVRAAVVAVTSALAPSETMRISRIHKAAHDAHVDVLGVLVTTPATDTAPTLAQDAIRVVTTDITLSWIEV